VSGLTEPLQNKIKKERKMYKSEKLSTHGEKKKKGIEGH
jgi:hypothetical protein